MKNLRDYLAESESWMLTPAAGDDFGIELADGSLVESYVLESESGDVLLAATTEIVTMLESRGMLSDHETDEEIVLETMGYGTLVGEEEDEMDEAKYHGREVPLGKPMKGDVKKSKVYVRDPSTGNIKKVNFGDPNMRIKKSSPAHRKSFRARHNCANPGPRTKARYWSCRAW